MQGQWLRAPTGSLYCNRHPLEIFLLKDNDGWGGGGIKSVKSMSFIAVGPEYPLVCRNQMNHLEGVWREQKVGVFGVS